MDASQMDKMRQKAFSPLTVFKEYRQSQLEIAIRNNPGVFVELITRSKIRPAQQMELMSFFLDLAFAKNGLKKEYKPHINLFLNDLTYTLLWPSSVSLLVTALARLDILLIDQTSYQ